MIPSSKANCQINTAHRSSTLGLEVLNTTGLPTRHRVWFLAGIRRRPKPDGPSSCSSSLTFKATVPKVLYYFSSCPLPSQVWSIIIAAMVD
ncbi:hypothetical protein P280DRAFT_90791 [Massarina eburnea CBS 473.64]|uniref:Uncharacterized protein n=1 Tax=Massarina eburnea CBS 473.64 TaxID=1395130 RepID=A0A6A6RRK6_9PLEO|nr:hypothetical protein P280DRAFT_90791 [Massarina eburnea CBS 473.64]